MSYKGKNIYRKIIKKRSQKAIIKIIKKGEKTFKD